MTSPCYNAKILKHHQKAMIFLGENIMANPVRTLVTLACTECKERNYSSSKNKRNNPDRIELNKFCPRCNKTTLHKETK